MPILHAGAPTERVPLSNRRILVLEDEYFLADDISRELRGLGAKVVGPLAEINEARDLLERGVAIDAAVLDVNIRSEMVFPLARRLRERNVPFMLTSGYDRSSIPAEFQDVPLFGKPLDTAAMARRLIGLIQ